ncbi:MAG: hypothetical protein MJZ61_09595 [Bacteroidales bacterium]|nr:hypothetical protein [Bacteroidales bacterium]
MEQNISMEEIWMLIQRLPQEEKKVLRIRLSEEEYAKESLAPYTMEEIEARLEEAERDFAEGRVYTSEEVHEEILEMIYEYERASKPSVAYA